MHHPCLEQTIYIPGINAAGNTRQIWVFSLTNGGATLPRCVHSRQG